MTRSAASTGDEEPWTNFNDSQLTPVIPNAIMWLVAEAEEVLRNDTWLDLDLALDMSRLQSVAYCHPPNVAAWNCTRQATLVQQSLSKACCSDCACSPLHMREEHQPVLCCRRVQAKLVEHMMHDECWAHFTPSGWSLQL